MDEIIAATNTHHVECMNQVKLTGSLVHKYRPRPNVIILTLAVQGRREDEVDYPNVVFYGDAAETIDNSIVIDKNNYPRVSIEGTIETTNRETPNGNRVFRDIVGHTIARCQTQMERLTGRRGIGNRKAEAENNVCIIGTVSRVFPIRPAEDADPTGAVIIIKTEIGGATHYPRVVAFGRMTSIAMDLTPGDVVCVTGFIETSQRTDIEGRRTYLQSVIATEIDSIDETD